MSSDLIEWLDGLTVLGDSGDPHPKAKLVIDALEAKDQRIEQLEADLEAQEQVAITWMEMANDIDHQYDAMQQIKSWCEAYPVDIFPEPDWTEARDKLGGKLLTRVSAANMRHVVEGIKRIITECEKVSTE